ncbi:MAG: FdhF/YdeP family oxidoreductase [Gammaproteobacteria bacterium]|nr:FdhF/YdeP family oxidoreductase [Gammaproteobacteria bacterium]
MNKQENNQEIVGGGLKKVLYTLNTVRKIGLKNSAKALTANNTCKACGLGMGGQNGGMVNELHEYPAVCNKSVQAQLTDIQPPIPKEIFKHSITDLKELTAHELEHLGRLGLPLYKSKENNHFQVVDWHWAINYSAKKFAQVNPDRSFFYASGRSSNEASFILQLLARLYGTNNISNCSYYCHQASGEGLSSTLGTTTATVELAALEACDLVFLLGANPSSNHPRLMHKLKLVRDRGGDVVVINPAREPGLVKFSLPKSIRSMLKGGDIIASEYLQPHIGSDLWLIKGIAKAIIASNAQNQSFIDQQTEGFEHFLNDILGTSWDDIVQASGIEQARIEEISALYARSENTIFAWGMGITHHLNGVNNVEYITNLALLRGMVGKPNAGLLPLRGHSNVQGIGSMGVKPTLPKAIFDNIEQLFNIKLPQHKGLDTLACLQEAQKGAMDAALILGGNLYAASPDSQFAEQALAAVDFKLFLSTSLNQGHLFGSDQSESLILPVTARDEEWQATTQESMFNFVRMSDGGIDRLDNVRPESDILCDLAQQLLPDSPIDFSTLKSHRAIRQAIAKSIPGMQQIADIDNNKTEFHVKDRVLNHLNFPTANQRACFITHKNTLPVNSKQSLYPIKLMTIRSEGQYNSIIYEEKDSYRNIDQRWSVMINADQMIALGIKEDDCVNLVSETGRMDKVRVYPFDIPSGNIMAYYPEANILVGQATDPRSKTPAFKSVPVRIEKLSDS